VARGFGIDVPDFFKVPTEPEWIYDGWFTLRDKIVVFTGDGGVGKTLLVGNLIVSLLRGTPFMGRSHKADTGSPTVLYLDVDMGFELAAHFAKVCSAVGVKEGDDTPWKERFFLTSAGIEHENPKAPVLPLGYTFGKRSSDFNTIRHIVDYTRPDVVVLDCWTDFCGLAIDTNRDTEVNYALRQLRDINPEVCWWIIHHETKSLFQSDGTPKKVQHRSSGSHMLMGKAHRNLSVVRTKTGKHKYTNRVDWGKIRHGGTPASFLYQFMERGPEGKKEYTMEFVEEVRENA
jgi:RecA-family ATPase